MSQFQRLASSHDHLIAAQTRLQQRGGQPGQETEPEPEVTQIDVAVEVQVQAMVIALLQATGAAEAQAQAMVSPEATPQVIGGDQHNTEASPFSLLCRWT